jgi:molecular chaperone GrpE
MSESAPPGLIDNAPVGPAPALTPEAIASVLADFQTWIAATVQTPEPEPPAANAEPVDLHTLLSQFIALRHEVNLQTRAVRTQQELNAETLRQLTETLEALETAQNTPPAQQTKDDEDARPLLKTLVDLHDALTVAGREIGRVEETVVPLLQKVVKLTEPYPVDESIFIAPPPCAAPAAAPTPTPPPWWKRWFGSAAPQTPAPAVVADPVVNSLAGKLRELHDREKANASVAREKLDRVQAVIASLAMGYTMSVQRLERALEKNGLQPMNAAGKPFDPERMEVVEAVLNSGRPSGEVVEEVRRGYLREGRVFRYAQVRVAKS